MTAIYTEEALPEKWAAYTELNAQWFADRDAARARVDELVPR